MLPSVFSNYAFYSKSRLPLLTLRFSSISISHSTLRTPNSLCRLLPSAFCVLKSCFLVVLLLAASLVLLTHQSVAAEVRAGVASAIFELPKGVPLAGYSRRGGNASEGTLDSVGVRAVFFKDGDTTVVLVSCDLLIIDEALYNAVKERLSQHMPPIQLLQLAATHTHSGPGAYGKRFFEKISMGHFDPDVFEAIVDKILKTIREAAADLAPIRIGCGSTSTEDLVANRIQSDGLIDAQLRVCAIYPHGKTVPIAVLTNFSAHPTTLGAWNMKLSADYPGVISRELKQIYPQTVSLFFAGSVGDQAPVKKRERFESTERIGKQLARGVHDILQRIGTDNPGEVRVVEDHLALDSARVRLGSFTLPAWLGASLVDDDAHLSVAVIGSAAFIGIPCDMTTELGATLIAKAQSHGWHPFLLGFTNDYIGYCITKELYDSGEYEATMAFNGPRTGQLIVERLIAMMKKLSEQE